MTILGWIVIGFIVALVLVMLVFKFSTKNIDDERSHMEHHNHHSDDFGIYSDKENI